MDKSLAKLIETLVLFRTTIDNASLDDFDRHGWNQVHADGTDISNMLFNLTQRLEKYGDQELPKSFQATISNHIGNIERLNNTAKSYFTDHSSHLISMVPSIILTISILIDEIDFELFSFENINDKNLLPRKLTARLRSAKVQIDSINESSQTLQEKIKSINDAHEAAESLPTDLAALKDARKELNSLIESAQKELNKSKEELKAIHEEGISLKNLTKIANEHAENSKIDAQKSADAASKLVSQCEEAYRITTTKGLAAAFDQRANKLSLSMWAWVIGLLLALSIGSILGTKRIELLSAAITPTAPQWGVIIMHILLSLLSVAAPLWFAWLATKQIGQRFRLAEDYGFKASVAKAYEGYRKEAARIDSAFEARLFASTLSRLEEAPLRLVEDTTHGSPWHELISSKGFQKAIDTVPELKETFIDISKKGLEKINIPKKDASKKPSTSE